MKKDTAYWRNLFRIYIIITVIAALCAIGFLVYGLQNPYDKLPWFLFACVLFINWSVYEFGVAVRQHLRLAVEAERNSKN